MMKIKLLVAISLFTAIAASGQDTIGQLKVNRTSHVGIGYGSIGYGKPRAVAWMDDRDSITIVGDTMVVIRELVKKIKRCDSSTLILWDLLYKKQKLINAAVDFANQVPDYFKNEVTNSAWNKYEMLLRKNGYYFTNKKKR
jgi:hypothetical protein